MKIREYLGLDDEKEAKLKEVATFSPERSTHRPRYDGTFSPFEKEVLKRARPELEIISEGNLPHPVIARVCLCYACTHNCSGCLYKRNEQRENAFMDSNNFSRLLRSLGSLKVKFIDLSGGGEPTLHPEFHELAKMSIREGFDVSLLCNAASFSPSTVDLMVEGFSYLRVNLDASNDEVYERIHHPPHPKEFQKVLKNLEKIVSQRERKKSNLTVGAETRLSQSNINFMEEMVCLVKDLGLNYIKFQPSPNAPDSLLPQQVEGVNRCIEELRDTYHPFPVYGEVKKEKLIYGCWFSSIHVMIDPGGDIYPCPHYAHRPEITSFGNIFTQSAKELWFGDEHRRLVENLRRSSCRVKECEWQSYHDLT